MINKQSEPTLEQRIVSILANANAGSEAVAELIEEVETAATTADQAAIDERARSMDLAHDPHQARDRIAAAEMTRDRLKTNLPKLRERLSSALRSETHERWLTDYHRVGQKVDEAVASFGYYQQHAEAITQMFAVAAEVDKEVSRINGNAPDGEHRRLRPVELEARNLTQFTRDNPSLSQTVQLWNWNSSGKSLWPLTSAGSLAAAAFAGSMTVPYSPGAAWSDPEVREQRRKEGEREQQRIGDHYARMTKEQEERLNREEGDRVAALRR